MLGWVLGGKDVKWWVRLEKPCKAEVLLKCPGASRCVTGSKAPKLSEFVSHLENEMRMK